MNLDGDNFGRLIYLVVLGTVVAGWFFSQNRQKLNKTLQQFVLWVFLFAGVVLLYGFKDDLRSQLMPRASVGVSGERLVLQRAADRHFYATLQINGQDVVFVVDTGATDMVLSRPDAEIVGLDTENLAYFNTAQTANGEVGTARVKLDEVVFGPYSDFNVVAWVNEGEMFGSLLGMSYLSRYSRLEIADDKMFLTR